MGDRGAYRAVKVVLLDGPDFQQLSERANHLFVFLKLSFGPSGIEVHYPDALVHLLAARTRIPADEVRAHLVELEDGGWIRREANVVWIVGQLEHDPHMKPDDEKHRKGVWRHVAGLPRLSIVGEFVAAHPRWFEPFDATTGKGEPKHLDAAPDSVRSLTTLRRAIEGPLKGLARASEAPTSDERIPNTENESKQPRRVSIVEKSDAPYALPPEFTKGQLMEAAKRECGMGLWDRKAEEKAGSVLQSWYGEGKQPGEIFGAIHGARLLVDRGKVEWLRPRAPFGLHALRNTFTLANQGDGLAQRPFFDVALEEYIRAGTGPPSRTASSTGPERLAVNLNRLAQGSNT